MTEYQLSLTLAYSGPFKYISCNAKFQPLDAAAGQCEELASRKANGGSCGMIYSTKLSKAPADTPNPPNFPKTKSNSRAQCALFTSDTYNPVTTVNPASPERSERRESHSDHSGRQPTVTFLTPLFLPTLGKAIPY